MIASILVVCTGNICRSPMAEGLFRQRFPKLEVASAGLDALSGNPPAPDAVAVMRSKSIDIHTHRAVQLESWMCRTHDLVLVMEAAQKHEVERRHPFARGKVFRLLESEAADVVDPYLHGPVAFQTTLDVIERGVSAWSIRLKRVT
ncbi:protein tyrosine phosphatase [Burkholderia sp. SG-MS1]|uniref:low molecular weight protein-tyrosine-phosphatase n=1 Tax=Paraburkholderia sp. SG-MS1 TaxID=2023741 RepID=UPI001446F25D|nr:low molecular weight protein-tyrosine-phosphatase [Paraburkholderia sp. SG-MS1]NKJ45216.1 protein tyrosine phosphatase [Paraburkholderia sp. SG-MS1]